MTDERQKAIKVKCKRNEFTTKPKIKNNGIYSSLEEAFDFR